MCTLLYRVIEQACSPPPVFPFNDFQRYKLHEIHADVKRLFYKINFIPQYNYYNIMFPYEL